MLVGGGEALRPLYRQCADFVRSPLLRMEPFGIASADVVPVDSLAGRLELETNAAESQVAHVPVVGVWTTAT